MSKLFNTTRVIIALIPLTTIIGQPSFRPMAKAKITVLTSFKTFKNLALNEMAPVLLDLIILNI